MFGSPKDYLTKLTENNVVINNHTEEIFPLKIFRISCFIFVQILDVFCQMGYRFKVPDINEWFGGCKFWIIGSTQYNGHYVVVENFEKLFSDVVFTNWVFKTEVELVLPIKHFQTLRFSGLGTLGIIKTKLFLHKLQKDIK